MRLHRWFSLIASTAVLTAMLAIPSVVFAEDPPGSEPVPGPQLVSAVEALPVTPGTRYVTASGVAFKPQSSALTYDYTAGGAISATTAPAGDGGYFQYALRLPNGSRITELTWMLIDNIEPGAIEVGLRSYDPTTGALTILQTGFTTGADAAVRVFSFTPVAPAAEFATTNSAERSHRLLVKMPTAAPTMQLVGVRVGYIPTGIAGATAGSSIQTDSGSPEAGGGAAIADAAISAWPAPVAGRQYETYSGIEVVRRDSGLGYAYIAGGGLNATVLPGENFLHLKFDLPNGATVTDLVVALWDADATDMSVVFRRYDVSANDSEILGDVASSGNVASIRQFPVPFTVGADLVVNQGRYAYGVVIAPAVANTNHRIMGARIGYTVPSPSALAEVADIEVFPGTVPGSYKTYAGVESQPRNSTTAFAYGGNGGTYISAGATSFNVIPLTLPEFTTIRSIEVAVTDNNAVATMRAFLTTYDPTRDAYTAIDLISGSSAAGADPAVQFITLTPAKPIQLDGTQFSYNLLIGFGATGPTTTFEGARVTYGPPPPQAVPQVFKSHSGGW